MMNEKIEELKFTDEYKKDLKKINELNNTVKNYTKKIKYTNAAYEMKGAFVDMCDQFVESMNKSSIKIEMHINKAIEELEKYNEIMNNIQKMNDNFNSLHAASIGLGTGLAIAKGIKDTKDDDDEEKKKKDKKEKNRGVEDGRL